MKKATLILALSSLSILAVANDAMPKTFTIRAGYSYLANKDARDLTSTSGFIVGVGYDLSGMMKGMGANGTNVSLDVDYDYHNGNSNKISNLSAQIVGRFPFSQETKKGGTNFYGGIGAGVFDTQVPGQTKANIGGTVLVGADMGGQFSLEASYRLVASTNGVTPATINFTIGMKF
ncbi:MAG: hypothetical protein JSS72_01740 [Armatimonadetes bacterium]|nr:hypothetical protein [Armatimonadota bacterium]